MIARYEYADVVSGRVWCSEWAGLVWQVGRCGVVSGRVW